MQDATNPEERPLQQILQKCMGAQFTACHLVTAVGADDPDLEQRVVFLQDVVNLPRQGWALAIFQGDSLDALDHWVDCQQGAVLLHRLPLHCSGRGLFHSFNHDGSLHLLPDRSLVLALVGVQPLNSCPD